MAEFEEVDEVLTEADDGVDTEVKDADELSDVEREELDAEAVEAKSNIKSLGDVVESIKNLDVPAVLKSFSIFIIKNAAIGAVFFGVTILLKKIVGGGGSGGAGQQAAQAKYTKLKAMGTLIKDLSKTSKTLLDWLKAHENDTVDVGGGITVPLPDIFTKYTKPMGTSLDTAFTVSKQLMTKDSKGKTTFNVPTTDQITQIITSSEEFVKALQGFVTFAGEKKATYPTLNSLPVTQDDVGKLYSDLGIIKQLPYA